MNQKMWLTPLVIGTALTLGGCGILKKKTPDAEPSATVAATTTAPAVVAPTPNADVAPVAAAAPALDDATIPASQDFEDEAFTTVTAANFKAQLTTLSTAISAK